LNDFENFITGTLISTFSIQESIANAKVSARQPWYIGHNSLNHPSLRNAQQCQRNRWKVLSVRNNSVADNADLSLYLHSFSRCCLPNNAK